MAKTKKVFRVKRELGVPRFTVLEWLAKGRKRKR